MIQTKQTRAAREQRNKYKPRTEQEQHLPITHAGRTAVFFAGKPSIDVLFSFYHPRFKGVLPI